MKTLNEFVTILKTSIENEFDSHDVSKSERDEFLNCIEKYIVEPNTQLIELKKMMDSFNFTK